MILNKELRTELFRGLASAVLLYGLLVGVPILLIVGVGSPLSMGIPSGSEALTAFKTGAFASSLILKPISLIVWILWLQMLAGVGIELWAHFHGQVAPRIPFIPLFMQRLSARLMGTALVIAFSMQHSGPVLADNKDLLAPTILEADVGQSWSLEFSNEETPSAPYVARSEAPDHRSPDPIPFVHTVERRDSLRMLAERYLGDPNRWTEVFVLNQGQTQADGRSLTDPARLQPGWRLVMPADARLPTSTTFHIDETPDGTQQPESSLFEVGNLFVTVQEGDTLWELADHHLNDPERWVDIFYSNQEIIQDPNVILPGWQLQIPAHDSEVPVAGLSTHPTAGPADPADPEPHPIAGPADPVATFATTTPIVVASVPSSSTGQQSVPITQTMLAVGGLGVFASSLGWVLARLRRIQRRRLPIGRIPLAPSNIAVQMDQQLQAAADPDNALFLDAALRAMSSRVAGSPPPAIFGVTLDSNSVTIHLSSPEVAPPGFHGGKGKMTWTLFRDADLEDLLAEADGVPAPLPALAAVGKSHGNEYLLNLEHIVALNLEGGSEAISGLCAAIATQLASSHLADDLTVMCVGFGQDLAVFERVDYAPNVASALERIRHHQRQGHALLGNHRSLAESRIGSSDDFWQPLVTLIPSRLSKEEASHLLNACSSSVCVVAHGLEGATWLGHLDDNGLLLEPISLRLQPHRIPGDAVAAFAELASIAQDTEGARLAEPPLPPLQHDSSDISLSDADVEVGAAPSDADIEVRVMGTVEVVGAAQPFSSRRALDLVAFLAFHPEGADRDQLKAQIWPPDDPPSNSTVANTVSRARKALGVDANNDTYLPRVDSKGIYRLRAGIGTDVDRFEALVSAARDEPGACGREHLQAALELARGTPFTGSAGDMYRWADFGLRTQVECLVDSAAHELAKRCIDADDFQGARRAAMTSLRLVGICEQCYHWRLMAAAENPTEVRQIMSELAGLLRRENDQLESDNLLRSDLLELYDQLLSSRSSFS